MDPLLILTEATKTLRVSHWGNILVDEYFNLDNIGAKVKGEFSRVDFEYYRKGDNCLKQISAKYPWYIQSMYFHDYIGNISTTNALRQESQVDLRYAPRYPICGGWKVDWNQGYQMPTKYHLTRAADDADLYTLEFDFLHNYDVLLAENYTVEVILPFGASDFVIESPVEYDSFHVEKSWLTLDFAGTPKLVIKKNNAFDYEHGKTMRITYRFN